MSKIIIVGGGAAGMMAAIGAKTVNPDAKVILLERNEKLGKKIYITGKGRCNLTNACDADRFFKNLVTNPKFMYSAFYTLDNHAVMELVESKGCKCKVERGERVFPVSDRASDVTAALKRKLDEFGVEIRLNTRVEGLLTEEKQLKDEQATAEERDRWNPTPAVTGVRLAGGKTERADAVILTTGGLSYKTTGSTGDGHAFLNGLGLQMTPCVPALVPLNTRDEWMKEVQGLALKNVSFSIRRGKKELYSDFGEMLFTHFGISGPLVLSASSYLKGTDMDFGELEASIDLKPALSGEELDKRLQHDFELYHSKQFKNSLKDLFPLNLIPIMVNLSGIDADKRCDEITKEERRAFGDLIKHLPVHLTSKRSFDEAIITQGGLSVKEVNPSTMECKRITGLYVAGELLDVDALTGGFNLQIAWSTGYLAGMSASEKTIE